jgi:hypothetical protein
MQNTTITTTQNTQLSITTTTTRNQFVKIAFPMQCAAIRTLAAKPNGLCGMSGENTALAVWANQLTNADALTGLLPSVAQETMRLMSLRTLKKELAYLEGKGDPKSQARAVVVGTVLSAGLREKLQSLALLCLNGKTEKYSEQETNHLLQACETFVLSRYAALSLDEIEAAFIDAAANGLKAYGVFNLQVLGDVLGAYKPRRDVALNAVLDQVAKDSQNIAHLQTIAEKNDVAYTQALGELEKLRVKNTVHQCFHTCPHHYIKRFLADGIIEVTDEAKREIWREAQQQLAYDLLNDAPPTTDKKALKAYLTANNIVPLPSLRIVRSDVFKANLSPKFDYSDPAKHFKEFAQTYYAKKLYFCNIQIFE